MHDMQFIVQQTAQQNGSYTEMMKWRKWHFPKQAPMGVYLVRKFQSQNAIFRINAQGVITENSGT